MVMEKKSIWGFILKAIAGLAMAVAGFIAGDNLSSIS